MVRFFADRTFQLRSPGADLSAEDWAALAALASQPSGEDSLVAWLASSLDSICCDKRRRYAGLP